jgi:PIN domain nuclease of toxin-antitoxin system
MILLDTHVLFWWISEKSKLTLPAIAAIEAEIPGGQILISSMSVWEVTMLVAAGRRTLSVSVPDWIAGFENIAEVTFIPVDNDIAVQSVLLPDGFHKDPADRIIVATARKFGAPIITADQKIRSYRHVRTIW